MIQEGLQSTAFNNFLDAFKDSAREEISKNYFHVDVVAEAYSQGFKDGEDSSKKSFVNSLIEQQIEGYKQRYLQAYILTNKVINKLATIEKKANEFFINIHDSNPKVVISIPNQYLLEDAVVEIAYSEIFKAQELFNSIFTEHQLDISFVGSDNLDKDLLTSDGFDYFEDLK